MSEFAPLFVSLVISLILSALLLGWILASDSVYYQELFVRVVMGCLYLFICISTGYRLCLCTFDLLTLQLLDLGGPLWMMPSSSGGGGLAGNTAPQLPGPSLDGASPQSISSPTPADWEMLRDELHPPIAPEMEQGVINAKSQFIDKIKHYMTLKGARTEFPELQNLSEERLRQIAINIGNDQFYLDRQTDEDALSFLTELKGKGNRNKLRRDSVQLVIMGLRDLKEKKPELFLS